MRTPGACALRSCRKLAEYLANGGCANLGAAGLVFIERSLRAKVVGK